MNTRNAHRSTRTREGAALVMTMGTMLVLVIVLMISSQYTLKSMRTANDQTVTIDAQYVGESGMAWAKANADELKDRFMKLGSTSKTINDFVNLITGVCGGYINTTVASGCNVSTSAANKTLLANFFTSWDTNQTDGLWTRSMTVGEHSYNLGNGQKFTVYNAYKASGTSTVTRNPMLTITRIEWDVVTNPANQQIYVDTFRFCYDIGYYVSQGVSGTGNRLVGQRPLSAASTTTSAKCATTSVSNGTTTGSGADPTTNYMEIDANGSGGDPPSTASVPVNVPPASVTTNDLTGVAGAVHLAKVAETLTANGAAQNTVTYRMCGQTNNTTQSCASNRNYYFQYNATLQTVSCYGTTGSATPTTLLNVNTPNKLYSCLVNDKANDQSKILFFVDNSTPIRKLTFILTKKTNGNNDVGRSVDYSNSAASNLVDRLIFADGVCLSSLSNMCTAASGVTGVNNQLTTYTPGYTYNTTVNVAGTPIAYTFSPSTTNADLIFEGSWVQLASGDL